MADVPTLRLAIPHFLTPVTIQKRSNDTGDNVEASRAHCRAARHPHLVFLQHPGPSLSAYNCAARAALHISYGKFRSMKDKFIWPITVVVASSILAAAVVAHSLLPQFVNEQRYEFYRANETRAVYRFDTRSGEIGRYVLVEGQEPFKIIVEGRP